MNCARKGKLHELEVIKHYEKKGYILIMRSHRFFIPKARRFVMVEFGCFDIVMGRPGGVVNKTERLLIQVKTEQAPKQVKEEMFDWYLRFGLQNESVLLVNRKKFGRDVVFEIHDILNQTKIVEPKVHDG